MFANPDHAALWQKTRNDFAARRYDDAEAGCRALVAFAPGQPLAYALLARLHVLRGHANEASRLAIEAGVRAAAGSWPDMLAVGIALLEIGEKAIAREVLGLIDPRGLGEAAALGELARCHVALGDIASARDCRERIDALARRRVPPRVPVHG